MDYYLEIGGDPNKLWLIEDQPIEQAKKYHNNLEDLINDDDHDRIIYYHENGEIHQHATYKDKETYKKAVEFLVKSL